MTMLWSLTMLLLNVKKSVWEILVNIYSAYLAEFGQQLQGKECSCAQSGWTEMQKKPSPSLQTRINMNFVSRIQTHQSTFSCRTKSTVIDKNKCGTVICINNSQNVLVSAIFLLVVPPIGYERSEEKIHFKREKTPPPSLVLSNQNYLNFVPEIRDGPLERPI